MYSFLLQAALGESGSQDVDRAFPVRAGRPHSKMKARIRAIDCHGLLFHEAGSWPMPPELLPPRTKVPTSTKARINTTIMQ